MASLAPYDAEGLDWLAGFSPEAIDEARLTLADQTEAHIKDVHAWLVDRSS